MSDSVSPPCPVCGGSGSVYVGDHDGAAMYATCDCTKPARTTDYDEVTDCPICPQLATDRDDALQDARVAQDALAVAEAARNTAEQDADQLYDALGEAFWNRFATAHRASAAHRAAVAGRVAPATFDEALIALAWRSHRVAVRVVPTGPEATK